MMLADDDWLLLLEVILEVADVASVDVVMEDVLHKSTCLHPISQVGLLIIISIDKIKNQNIQV